MTVREGVATPVPVTGTGVVSAVPCVMVGYSLRSTHSEAASYFLWDNASAASGAKLADMRLGVAVHESVAIPGGVMCTNGIYLESGGAIVGTVWVKSLYS